MRVLIACEFSGNVRDAFLRLGHDAWSCDLDDVLAEGEFRTNHLKGDCRQYFEQQWDLLIAHPPCTYLCNSGVRWLHNEDGTKNVRRWKELQSGASFFQDMLNAPISKIAVENPIMHGYAKKLISRDFSQLIQPYEYGHPEVKATCLWLKNLPQLQSTEFKTEVYASCRHAPPSATRSRDRSLTYKGVAKAMAEQWGPLP